jgi:EAL domain-containing protein (putative c-di-GMP-specific phosphodiesterase class I)/GGDEF domain-containing protein
MSLFRRIWLMVILLTLVAFAGSLLVSINTARHYLEQQLRLKNIDNAGALALSISRTPDKDPVTLELLVSAQFDNGHYQSIRLVSPRGRPLAERHYAGGDVGAPAWFMALFPIRAQAGVAQVQDGWRQLGKVTVESHSRYAYRELWRGARSLAGWFALAGVGAGIAAMLMLRLVTRPLSQVVVQAEAISQRHFITLPDPKARELRSVVQALNDMVERVRLMFANETARLNALRHQVNHDPLTGLANRRHFLNRLSIVLDGEEAATHGVLVVVRLNDLAGLHDRLGHARVEHLIKDIAGAVESMREGHPAWLTGRLNDADIALLAPRWLAASDLAERMTGRLGAVTSAQWRELGDLFHVSAAVYERGEAPAALLANVDRMLAVAESKGEQAWAASEDHHVPPDLAMPAEQWRQVLSAALAEGRIGLGAFPVVSRDGGLLHQECLIRLQVEPGGSWLGAGDFMPVAARLKLAPVLDLATVRLVLDMPPDAGGIAINLSAETVSDWAAHRQLLALLRAHPDRCQALWLEVAEYGAFRHFEALSELYPQLRALGCRVGIEHFGHHFADIPRLADLGLDYIKMDSAFIRAIEQNPGNQEFLGGVCQMAQSMGVRIIAEGVSSDAEHEALGSLGFDGMTGPAITRRQRADG